jgi:hypothetical protein
VLYDGHMIGIFFKGAIGAVLLVGAGPVMGQWTEGFMSRTEKHEVRYNHRTIGWRYENGREIIALAHPGRQELGRYYKARNQTYRRGVKIANGDITMVLIYQHAGVQPAY